MRGGGCSLPRRKSRMIPLNFHLVECERGQEEEDGDGGWIMGRVNDNARIETDPNLFSSKKRNE